MKLSKRLQAVADLVTPGNKVADVGCDHAYISIYLAESRIAPYVIAMDVNQGPIDKAKENIAKYGFLDRIETRKSDGLEKLNPDEADTILIAGMGGALAAAILTKKPEVFSTVKELVLQPQSEIYKVREMLTQQDFLIVDENMVKEDGKYYVMMKAVPRRFLADCTHYELKLEEDFQYGRLLLERRHPVLKKFLLWDMGLCDEILRNLEMEHTDNAKQRYSEIEERRRLLGRGMGYYNS
jgi:tRNA (adenine22-N1)-methyltransferase